MPPHHPAAADPFFDRCREDDARLAAEERAVAEWDAILAEYRAFHAGWRQDFQAAVAALRSDLDPLASLHAVGGRLREAHALWGRVAGWRRRAVGRASGHAANSAYYLWWWPGRAPHGLLGASRDDAGRLSDPSPYTGTGLRSALAILREVAYSPDTLSSLIEAVRQKPLTASWLEVLAELMVPPPTGRVGEAWEPNLVGRPDDNTPDHLAALLRVGIWPEFGRLNTGGVAAPPPAEVGAGSASQTPDTLPAHAPLSQIIHDLLTWLARQSVGLTVAEMHSAGKGDRKTLSDTRLPKLIERGFVSKSGDFHPLYAITPPGRDYLRATPAG